ncbi:tetratricopeptide repeat protein [bacterium]|nr:tetratricopeptide repeat protein [bacterium]
MKKNICILLFFYFIMNFNSAFGQSAGSIVDLIRKGKIEEAKRTLNSLDKNRYTPDLLLFLNGLLSTDGDEAVKNYTKLIKEYPQSPYCDDALLRIAQQKYASGLYKQAKNEFIEITNKFPNSPLKAKCIFWAGMSLYALGQEDSALMKFSEILRKYPDTEIANSSKKQIELLSGKKQVKKDNLQNNRQTPAFSIQVGAFTRQQNAILRKSFFEKKGYRVELKSKMKNGMKLYLVWIGAFSSREEAYTFGNTLKKRYGLKYTLITR